MEYRLSDTAHGPMAILTGRFTHADRDEFSYALKELDARQGQRLTFDLSGVEFIDSAALAMILLVRQQAAQANREVALRGARGQVSGLIALTRFSQMFLIED